MVSLVSEQGGLYRYQEEAVQIMKLLRVRFVNIIDRLYGIDVIGDVLRDVLVMAVMSRDSTSSPIKPEFVTCPR